MAEQRIEEEGLDFEANEELNLGFKRGFERFVGIVRDIVKGFGDESLVGLKDWKWRKQKEEEIWGKSVEGRVLDSEWMRLVVEGEVLDKMRRIKEAELESCDWLRFCF